MARYKIFLLFAASLIIFISIIISMIIVKAAVSSNGMVLTKTVYGVGEIIEGFVNLSLSNEFVDASISALGKNITLLAFLKKNALEPEKDFYCTPADCLEYYEILGSSMKQETLTAGKSVLGGMIIGRDIEIKSNALEFSMQGAGGGALCGSSPLQLDVLADSKIDWIYMEPGELCGSLHPSSCYDDTIAVKEIDVTTSAYCQKIFLPLSGRFKLATLVKKNKGNGDLVAFIYNKKTGMQAECDLAEPNVTSYIEESCMLDLNVFGNEQDYYVCIRDNLAENAYTIKAETSEPICGYTGLPGLIKNASADFALFVQQTAIMPLSTEIKFNEQEFSKFTIMDMSQYIQDYLSKRYNNDCLGGCIIPISITSSNGITIKDFSLSYCAQGLCTTEQSFFELKRKAATVSINATQLDLRVANLSADEYGTQIFKLMVDDKEIGRQEITVERVPVIKNLVAIGLEAGTAVNFFVEAFSPKNNSLVSYEWIFGDGSKETTTVSFVNHTYTKIGKFIVIVRITDSQGLTGSRSFEIMVGSPRDILNATLQQKRIFLEVIKIGLGKEGWYKPLLEKQLEISNKELALVEYENQFRFATSDTEYIELISKVEKLTLPKSLYDSEFIAEMPVAVDVDSIKPELVESLNGGTYDANFAAETRNAIWAWQYKNLAILASSKVIGVTDERENKEDVATIVTLALKPLVSLDEVYLVVLASYDDALFASEYGQQEAVGNIGFVFKNLTSEKRISFALPNKVDIVQLVLFASPYLTELEIFEQVTCNSNRICEKQLGENWRNCRQDCKPAGIATFLFIVILAVMLLLYFMLQKWYKTRYEKYLFKSLQDLHNLISFATSSLRKGEGENNIRKKLKQAGWSSEQVNYVFKKMKGKKIEMPEVKLRFKFKNLNFLKHRKI